MSASFIFAGSDHGIVSFRSKFPFAETVRRLQSGFAEKGIKVFATIDQSAEASAAGQTLSPTTLILFGNPKAGTPLMSAKPQSGVDLPLKALVIEPTPGEVQVIMNSADYLIERHALPTELLNNIAAAEKHVNSLIAT